MRPTDELDVDRKLKSRHGGRVFRSRLTHEQPLPVAFDTGVDEVWIRDVRRSDRCVRELGLGRGDHVEKEIGQPGVGFQADGWRGGPLERDTRVTASPGCSGTVDGRCGVGAASRADAVRKDGASVSTRTVVAVVLRTQEVKVPDPTDVGRRFEFWVVGAAGRGSCCGGGQRVGE